VPINDTIYTFDKNAQSYGTFTRRTATVWSGGEPTIGVADGFFLLRLSSPLFASCS
jgi:hypothetical protein